MPQKLKVSLTVLEGEDKGRIFELKDGKTVIGRTGVDIVLRDSKTSRKHAAIEVLEGKVQIMDLGSTNGVFVNGARIESCELKNLDEITIGFTRLSVAVVEDLKSFKDKNIGRDKTRKSGKDDIAKLIDEELSRFSRWDVSQETSGEFQSDKAVSKCNAVLNVTKGPDEGKALKLKSGTTILGRGKKADLNFKDIDMSRAHCEIEVYGKDQCFIRDLASTNGTYINNKRVSYSRLKSGDVIQTGNTVMEFTLTE